MGEFDYERDGKAKIELLEGQRTAGEIGRIGEAIPRGKSRTGDHGEGRDEETRGMEGLRTTTWLVTVLPVRPERRRNPTQPVPSHQEFPVLS